MKPAYSEADLLARLQAAGLNPQALDPWETWKVFKKYLEAEVEGVYDAGSVQCGSFENEAGGNDFCLFFVRQFSQREGLDDAPLGRVIIELAYDVSTIRPAAAAEAWTHDYRTLSEFATVVEGLPQFQSALNAHPKATDVYQEEL